MQVFFEEYYYLLSYASSYSVLVPLLAGLFLMVKFGYKSEVFRGVLLYVAFIAAVEASGILSIVLGTDNNIWISHVYVPLEYILVTAIYYRSFAQKKIRAGMIGAGILFLLFCLAELLWGAGVQSLNSYSRVMESTLLIALALLYLFVLYKDLNYIYLAQDPLFVLSCGVMVYFAGTAMAYGMFNKALAISDNLARVCLSITYILNISFNCLLVVVQRKAVSA